MSDLITRDQVTILVRKIFDRTISTSHAPVPYVSWVGADVNTLRWDWAAAPAVDIPGLAAADIDNSVSSLKEIADVFLDRQPRGTRGWGATLQEVHNWLRGAGQSAKCDRIATFYPNTDALNGNTDFYQVITEFVTDISDGAQIFISRLDTGKTWINSWKKMVLQLAEIKVILPKVQLKRAGSKKSLLEVSGALIDARDEFWRTYATWIQTRAEDICQDGLRKA